MSRTLETLSDPSVSRISIAQDWRDWWENEVVRARNRTQLAAEKSKQRTTEPTKAEGASSATDRGDSSRSGAQWGETLPGHGGT